MSKVLVIYYSEYGYGKSVDFMDRESIRGIIDYCRNTGQGDNGQS